MKTRGFIINTAVCVILCALALSACTWATPAEKLDSLPLSGTGDGARNSTGTNDALGGQPEEEIQLTGTVETLSAHTLTVDGQTVILSESTEIVGAITTDQVVNIGAWVAADGSLRALRIALADDVDQDPDHDRDASYDDECDAFGDDDDGDMSDDDDDDDMSDDDDDGDGDSDANDDDDDSDVDDGDDDSDVDDDDDDSDVDDSGDDDGDSDDGDDSDDDDANDDDDDDDGDDDDASDDDDGDSDANDDDSDNDDDGDDDDDDDND